MRQIIILFCVFCIVSVPALAADSRPTEYPTYTAHVNGITVAYQDFGDPANDTILLVMGLGGQLIHWDDDLVLELVNAGYRVIRFDNRDAGWSEKLVDAPTPGVLTGIRYKLGMSLNAPYKLDDMAADSYALLEHLNIARAHVVGMSMGGMIAQIMAARYPERVQSLTSIMSTTSAAHLPQGSVQLDMDAKPKTREERIAGSVKIAQLIDGTVAELSADEWQKTIARGYDRAHYDAGFARQLWAILDSGDRIQLLKSVTQPTVVIHGKADTLIPYQGGEHTAEMVKGSKLVLLDGMGHYLDRVNKPKVIAEILEVAAHAK